MAADPAAALRRVCTTVGVPQSKLERLGDRPAGSGPSFVQRVKSVYKPTDMITNFELTGVYDL